MFIALFNIVYLWVECYMKYVEIAISKHDGKITIIVEEIYLFSR